MQIIWYYQKWEEEIIEGEPHNNEQEIQKRKKLWPFNIYLNCYFVFMFAWFIKKKYIRKTNKLIRVLLLFSTAIFLMKTSSLTLFFYFTTILID